MAAKSTLQIIIDAVTGGAVKGIDKVDNELSNLNKTAKIGKTTWTELSSAFNLASQVMGGLKNFINDTAGATLEYANNVRALKTAIGATPEEASKLIQVADDMNISFQQLTSALEAGIRKGVKPTIENISALSDEYLSLAPGVERTEFLMEKFGRTGQDLARLMELGSEKIGEMGDEIEGTARLMDQDALDAAEDYRLALDNMNDTVQDLKLSIGKGLIPELNELAKWADRNVSVTNILNEAYEKGLITQLEYTRAGSFLFGSEEKNMRQVEEIAKKLEGYNRMLADAEKRSRGAGRSTDEHRKAVTTLDATIESANGAMTEQQAILDGYSTPAQKAEQAIMAAAAAEAEAYRNARNWKSSLWESVSLLDRLNTMDMNFGDKIKTQLDQMKWDEMGGDVIQGAAGRINKALESGAITKPQAEEMLKELAIASDTLEADMNGIDLRTLTKTIADDLHIPLDEAKLKAEAAIEAIKAGALEKYIYTIELRYIKSFSGGLPEEFKAAGGPVKQGLPYIVGERGPELFVPDNSGDIIPNNRLGSSGSGVATGGAPIIVNVNTQPGMDPQQIASAVIARLSNASMRSRSGSAYAGV
jgi:hypothetical protein